MEAAPKSTEHRQEEGPKKRRVLEIGAGTNPLMFASKEEVIDLLGKDSEATYVALDLDAEDLAAAQRNRIFREEEKPLFAVAADARKLPFGNESFDEVYMSNVTSSPYFFDNVPAAPNTPAREEEATAFLEELSRVLAPGGSLYMLSTNTATYAESWYKKRREQIERYFDVKEYRGEEVDTLPFINAKFMKVLRDRMHQADMFTLRLTKKGLKTEA